MLVQLAEIDAVLLDLLASRKDLAFLAELRGNKNNASAHFAHFSAQVCTIHHVAIHRISIFSALSSGLSFCAFSRISRFRPCPETGSVGWVTYADRFVLRRLLPSVIFAEALGWNFTSS